MEREAAHILEADQVAGIIAPILEVGLEDLERLHQRGLPVVRIYREHSITETSVVALDDARAGIIAAEHLINLGHRRIAHIARDLSFLSGAQRLEGYKTAMARHGLPVLDELIVEGAATREAGYHCMKKLLELPQLPTGVFASNDAMAVGAYDAIAEAGLSIPRDISIVGHDDIDACAVLRPKLTTMTTHRHQLGEAAVDLLFKQIDSEDGPVGDRVFTAELVLRASTAPPGSDR